jgi:hypothetical protein
MYETSIENSLSYSDLCFSSKCFNDFEVMYSGAILVLKFCVSLVWIYVLVSGVYIALKNYLMSVRTSALSSHVSHITMFKNYVEDEVGRIDGLRNKKINVFVWYQLAFPLSPSGDVSISEEYDKTINIINSAVNDTNESMTSPKGRYSYKIHQDRMIKAVKPLGISLDRLPRNDFYRVEEEIFELIDSVNQTFSKDSTVLSNLTRSYI